MTVFNFGQFFFKYFFELYTNDIYSWGKQCKSLQFKKIQLDKFDDSEENEQEI